MTFPLFIYEATIPHSDPLRHETRVIRHGAHTILSRGPRSASTVDTSLFQLDQSKALWLQRYRKRAVPECAAGGSRNRRGLAKFLELRRGGILRAAHLLIGGQRRTVVAVDDRDC